MTRPLDILTWHVHGSYLYYLSHVPHRLYLPVKPGRPEGYGGRLPGFPWSDNVVDVPADRIRDLGLDCILFQSRRNWEIDQFEILSPAQRRLPRIFLEHDPPREHPTDTHHPVDDPDVLLVHVTAFNDLMWDAGRTPTRVIEHGVVVPDSARYTGELERGIVVVNGLPTRGRRLGADVLAVVRERVPLEVVGMESERIGGLGEASHAELPMLAARHRFFFHPIRYTSLGLAVCEAMLLGVPVVALATTEMTTVITNGVSGFVDTRIDVLVDAMRRLLADGREARRLGANARRTAQERFGIGRFISDWNAALADVTGRRLSRTERRSAYA
ncbi:MAG TPA: glycosyltransferase family 4 protein [Gammaproteobacteria bacterium]